MTLEDLADLIRAEHAEAVRQMEAHHARLSVQPTALQQAMRELKSDVTEARRGLNRPRGYPKSRR